MTQNPIHALEINLYNATHTNNSKTHVKKSELFKEKAKAIFFKKRSSNLSAFYGDFLGIFYNPEPGLEVFLIKKCFFQAGPLFNI